MGINITSSGNFKKTEKFLSSMKSQTMFDALEPYARDGVSALAMATPTETGRTADSWDYNIDISESLCRISWTNSNINNGVNIAVILQYGHGTKNGGYVEGRDYINPAISDTFNKLADQMWRAVQKA